MAAELLDLSLVDLAAAIRARRVSAVEAAQASITRAEALQPRLNAFIALEAEAALEQARAADAALARGDAPGLLHGVPLAHKDMYYRAGRVSTCGSKIRRHFRPDVTATVIARLERAGAVHLGGLNMSEFASNPTGHNDHWGDCRNPWNPDHVTGGSSSGSGAAVAARIVSGALGSDTGGSIRLPAALCGVSGIKPTYGRVSRYGVMPLSASMDHVGPLARSARDCARLLTVLAGHDSLDPTSSRRPVPDYEAGIEAGVKGLRLGVATGYFAEGVHPEVERAVAAALAVFRGLGATVVPVDPPDLAAINAFGMVLARAESAAIHGKWLRERPDDYSPLVREWLEIGLTLPATRYVEALNMRGPLLTRFRREVFGRVDLLLAPTTPMPAPTLAESSAGAPGHSAIAGALAALTRPFNYLGLPSLALPCGFSTAGLPVSFQLVGRPFAEADLFRAGHAFQGATDWHRRAPD